jgi:O-antigen/teichoic acid export membrane protein
VLTIGSAIKIYFDGNISFFDGCGKMAFTTKLRIAQTLIFISSFFIFLKLQIASSIYIYPFSLLVSYLLIFTFIQFSNKTFEYKQFFKKIFHKNKRLNSLIWFNRIFTHQIKISISWISGYFISQIPLLFLFKYLGPESSGKYGFTINLLNSITNLSLIFIHTINPRLAYYTSIKDYDSLNTLFNERVKMSVIFNSIFILGFWLFKLVIIDKYQILFNDRFISNNSILILSFMTYLGIYTSSISCYVRSNREEPLMFNSIITAVIVFICSLLIIKNSSVDKYILYSSFIILLVETPWFLIIYLNFKNKIYKK